MKPWMKLIPAAEIDAYRRAGFLRGERLGNRPLLLVVDVTYGFTGSEGLTLEQAIAEFAPACGPVSWETMPRIARLVQLFRDRHLPVIYTRSDLYSVPFTGKSTKRPAQQVSAKFNEFPPAIAPQDGEWVLEKTKASAFFGTPLASRLVRLATDTVVVGGVSTSGCVRASVVDAFSHNFRTFLVEDCCFDRSQFAHAANLFDMHAKYATVLSLAELEEQLRPAAAGHGAGTSASSSSRRASSRNAAREGSRL